jgi:hypothetical protein
MNIIRSLLVASAAFFFASIASAQNPGTVTNHAFALGKGAGVQGFTSLLCPSGQFPMGQTSADPQCVAISGDATITAAGVLTVGANKVTLGKMATMAADTVIGNNTGSTATPSAVPLVNCANALIYSTSSHTFGCNVSAGTGTVTSVAAGGGATTDTGSAVTGSGTIYVQNANPGGRLTLTASTPVTTTDVTAATVVNYAPMSSGYVPIYNGTVQRLYQFTSSDTDTVGLQVTLGSNWASGSQYDWFVGINSSTVTLCSGPAWSSDTARGTGAGTTELQLFKGLWTNKNSMTCRYGNATTFTCAANQCTYFGTSRMTAAGQTEDSAAKRYVWNAFNQVQRTLQNVTETTDSWNYTTATYRQANANTANQIDAVIGLAGNPIEIDAYGIAQNTGGNVFMAIGIGVDSTTTNSAQIMTPATTTLTSRIAIIAKYRGFPAIGRHYYPWLEYSTATGTTSFYGDNGQPTLSQSGISGFMAM